MIGFKNCILYTSFEVLPNAHFTVEGNRFLRINHSDDLSKDIEWVDLQGASVAPGLVDLQIYGAEDILFSAHLTEESLINMSNTIAQSGTTSYLLTLATNTQEIFKKAIEVAKKVNHAALRGIHFEGPFLNPLKRGAHVEAFIHPASINDAKEMVSYSEGLLKMLTIAPELHEEEVLNYFLLQHVILSAGHSNASFEEATHAFNLGVHAVTHLYNAMSPIHHRNVGLPGAAFLHEKVKASIIPDGIHVDYSALKLSKEIMKERLFLITDRVATTLTGPYLHVKNGDHFALPNGTLSGSAISLFEGVMNCVKHAEIDLAEALRMATLYPAQLLNDDSIGCIRENAEASFIIFDEQQQLKQVYLKGKKI